MSLDVPERCHIGQRHARETFTDVKKTSDVGEREHLIACLGVGHKDEAWHKRLSNTPTEMGLAREPSTPAFHVPDLDRIPA